MQTEEKTENTTKLPWYLKIPVLIILFFIFPPVTSIISIILFIKRWKISDSKGKRKLYAITGAILLPIVIFIVYGMACSISYNKKLEQINTAISSGDYTTAAQLIDEEYEDEYVSYSIVIAKSRMYEAQGMYDEAASVILEYWDKMDDKSQISNSTVERLESYKNSCEDETSKNIITLLNMRKTAIEQKSAQEQAQLAAEQAKEDAQEAKKAEKAAKKQAEKEAKANEKAQKAAKKQAEKEEKANEKAQKAAKKQAEKEEKDISQEDVQPPTKQPPKPTTYVKNQPITNEQEAIAAVKNHAQEEGFSDPYDKFTASKEGNSYFVMAGHSYLGDSWEGSADMYDVIISTGEVVLRGMADDVLSEKGTYEAQIVQSYTYNGFYTYDLKLGEQGFFGRKITGYVKNNNNYTANITVLFRFYDENSIQIGTENQLIENIAPGTTASVSVYAPYNTASFDVPDIRKIDIVIYE